MFLPNIKGQSFNLTKWFYNLGDIVDENKPICEISNKKLMLEFEPTISGKLVWVCGENKNLNPGDEICKIEQFH